MSIFDSPGNPSYDLTVDHIGGAFRVDAQSLIDILEQRAILVLRAAGTANVSERITDFERGRFAELQELYNAIEKHVRR